MLVKNSIGALVTTIVLPLAVQAAPEVYTVDSDHTFPSFETSHRAVALARQVQQDHRKDLAGLALARRAAWRSRSTHGHQLGLPVMEKVLQNEEWLSTEKYPTATYKGTISYKGDKPAEVSGDFTLRGITIPLKPKSVHSTAR
jgi:polyisoprenoid-binding protein YceI